MQGELQLLVGPIQTIWQRWLPPGKSRNAHHRFCSGGRTEKKCVIPHYSFCEAEGMRLYFLGREAYREKEATPMVQEIIMENQYAL